MRIRPILIGSICLLWPLISANAAYSRTWHLNPGGTGDALSIEAACDSASASDTIALSQGTYIEHAVCDSLNDLTLVSVDGPRKAIIRADWTGPTLAFFWGNNIRIDGLAFEGSQNGLYFYWCSDIELENSAFRDIGNSAPGSALSCDRSSSVTIESNYFVSNYEGVNFDEFNSDIIIRRNTFLDNEVGIYMNTATYVIISNNLICGSQYGIHGVPVEPTVSCNNLYANAINYDLVDVPDPTGTNGNISLDPQFCAVDPVQTENYFLQSDSPCAPGNHPQGYGCGLIGGAPVGCSTVSIRSKTWSGIKQMYK